VHGNGVAKGMGFPGFLRELELDLNRDGNGQWRIQDFRKGVAGVELRRREETEDRGAVGADGCGEGCLPPHWVCAHPNDIF